MRTTTALRVAGVALAATAVTTWTATAFAEVKKPTANSSTVTLTNEQRTLIHEATKNLTTVAEATAAGYVPVSECTELPGVGGMGVHYLNPGYASDTVVDPVHPD